MKNKYVWISAGFLLLWFAIQSVMLGLPEMSSNAEFVPPDAVSYVRAGHAWQHDSASAIRPFGYSLITALTGVDDSGAISVPLLLFQVLCWLLSGMLIYRVAGEYLNGRVKYIPLLAFVFSPTNLLFTWLTLSETLFAFLLLLSAFVLGAYFKNPGKSGYIILLNAIMVFACVVRPAVQLPLFIVLVWTFYECFKSNSFRWKVPVISLLLVAGLMGVQLTRMKREFGTYTLSHIGKMAWYQYLGAVSESLANAEDLKITRKKRDTAELNYLAQNATTLNIWQKKDELYSQDFKLQWQQHKKLVLKALVLNIIQNATAPSAMIGKLNKNDANKYRRIWIIINYKITAFLNILISLVLLPISFVLALYFWIRERHWIPVAETLVLLFAASLALFLLITSGMSMWQGDRFSMVYYPLVIISVIQVIGKFRLKLR